MYNEVVFPFTCSIKYANFSSLDYVHAGVGSITAKLVKQHADFSFGFFSAGFWILRMWVSKLAECSITLLVYVVVTSGGVEQLQIIVTLNKWVCEERKK
jgi:hypothetical protein